MQLDSLAIELVEMEDGDGDDAATGLAPQEIEALPCESVGAVACGVGAACVICQEDFETGEATNPTPPPCPDLTHNKHTMEP